MRRCADVTQRKQLRQFVIWPDGLGEWIEMNSYDTQLSAEKGLWAYTPDGREEDNTPDPIHSLWPTSR